MTILGVRIDSVRRTNLTSIFEHLFKDGRPHTIATPNPEMLVAASRDAALRDILNRASLNLPDGIGVVIIGRLQCERVPERVTGVDALDDLMRVAAEHGWRVAILGGFGEVSTKVRTYFTKRYPAIQIVFAESGGLIRFSESGIVRDWSMNKSLFEQLRTALPEILVAGLGQGRGERAGKQELWIYDHLPQLPSVKIAIGVGGALDYYAGRIRRAPRFLQRIGLEWFWRLVIEPWRWRRILTAVILFPFLSFVHNKKV